MEQEHDEDCLVRWHGDCTCKRPVIDHQQAELKILADAVIAAYKYCGLIFNAGGVGTAIVVEGAVSTAKKYTNSP